ncbi:MAG: phosphoglycerate dehydrogenase [Pseudomonadota bacterium]
MYSVRTLNNISINGLRRLPRDNYEVASELAEPDAILVRSFKMHDMEIPQSVQCIGRAGAGTNNIPIEQLSDRGVPVFNAPGANANAVKELVLAGLFLAARNIKPALTYVADLDGTDAEISKAVEAGKKQYAGNELPGRTLGVIGLGAIGVQVCNAALALGMNVVGFDPHMTVARAWQLSAGVDEAVSVDHLLGQCDMVSVHVPLVDATRGLINAERLKLMPAHAVLLNMARGGVVDDEAVVAALEADALQAYVTDFPNKTTIGHEKVVALPHLGASTAEAEDNCAMMVADTVKDYLENGNIRHSVNFPDASLPRAEGSTRLSVANRNVPNMVGQISTILANGGLNIADLLNKSRGELAYTIVDVDGTVDASLVAEITAIEGVLNVRLPGHSGVA